MKVNWLPQGVAYSIKDVLNFLMKERHFTKEQMLDFLKNLPNYNNPFSFTNMKAIVDKIKKAIKENKVIYIFGDYDSDGVDATYILYMALSYLNANVYYKLPHRLKDGYGLKVKSIEELKEKGAQLIITVDNGIAAIEAVEKAKELGIDIIVTDHHQPQEKLPDCLFLDAHVEGQGYPFKDLCGAGVAFKVASALIDDFEHSEIYNDLLVAASIGTIADVMPIYGENRRIVIDGLKLINNGDNIGIQKLLEGLEINGKEIDGDTIGFKIGPCINASGRLDTPLHSLNLLLADDSYSASVYSKKIIDMNEKRKALQKEIADSIKVNNENKVIIATVEEKVAGIAGILANTISEKYMKPCFILHDSGDILGGSARTYGKFPVIECLNNSRDLIISGGGHQAACGLSLYKDNLEEFQKKCNETFEKWLKENPDGLIQDLFATCEIEDLGIISLKLIENISKLKPFGEGNPEPVFISRGLDVEQVRVVGKNQNVLQFNVIKNDVKIKCVGFESFKNKFEELGKPKKIDLMYKIGTNEWPKGTKNIQLMAIDIKRG